MTRIGTIAELWRYPVKSMRGERVLKATLEANGIAGDRRFAFASGAAPAGKPLLASWQRTAMLGYTARFEGGRDGGQVITITAPDGKNFPLHAEELLTHLQASLSAAPATTLPATLHLKSSPAYPLTDVRPLALLSAGTVRQLSAERGHAVDAQRFRSNFLLDLDHDTLRAALGELPPFVESALEGRTVRFGNPPDAQAPAVLLRESVPRCRIVSLDPETNEADPSLLRHLALRHNGRLGLYARVLLPGIVRTGDPVFLLPG